MKYIEDYRDGDKCSGTYLCKVKNTLKTKAGKNYYSLFLQDKTGTVDAKVWELNNGIESFESMDYIHIEGMVTSFQGSLQWNLVRIRRSQEGEYNPGDYMPSTKKNVAIMYEEILSLVESIENTYLRTLVESYFVEDKEFVVQFKKHSAAKSVHHGFMGGLLEHTLGVAKTCDYMASQYPVLNRDLLISAALFHDIGKMTEISSFPANDYTDDGQLLGHIFIGAEKLGQSIAKIPGFPKPLANEIRHCILAHHGELAYGSPKKPALVEAVALNLADNVDAKMETMTEIFSRADDSTDWIGYNRLFESNLRKSSGNVGK